MEQLDQNISRESKASQFFKDMQAVDLQFYDTMDKVILVIGLPKVGKTTCSHLLAKSLLRTVAVGDQLVYSQYSQNNKSARIDYRFEPAQMIPNLFNVQIVENNESQIIKLVDMPGFVDSADFYRIISEAYSTYRVFSKSRRLKFILVTQMQHIKHDIQSFRKVIYNFYKTFKHNRLTKSQRSEILQSVCVLVTKADEKTTVKQLIERIKKARVGFKMMNKAQLQFYQDLIDQILVSQKVFLIPRPNSPNKQVICPHLLQQIYDKTSFWERKQESKGQVDMQCINYNVTNKVYLKLYEEQNVQFRQEFLSYLNQLDKNKYNIFKQHRGSFVNTLRQLQSDIVWNDWASPLLENLIDFNQTYFDYSWRHQQKRQQIMQQLCKQKQRFNHLNKAKHKIPAVNKLKVLGNIKYVAQHYSNLFRQETSYLPDELTRHQQILCEILKKLMDLQLENMEDIICKYNYVMHRCFQQVRVQYLVLFNHQPWQIQDIKYFSSKDFHNCNIIRFLHDSIYSPSLEEIVIQEIKQKFIRNLDVENKPFVDQSFLEFLEQCSRYYQFGVLQLSKAVIRFANVQLAQFQALAAQQLRVPSKYLYRYRSRCYDLWKHDSDKNPHPNQQLTAMIVKLTSILANTLQKQARFCQAIQCCRSINNVDGLIKVHQSRLDEMLQKESLTSMSKNQDVLNFYLEYAQEAVAHSRKELAMELYHKAYFFAASKQQRDYISELITICQQLQQEGEKQTNENQWDVEIRELTIYLDDD